MTHLTNTVLKSNKISNCSNVIKLDLAAYDFVALRDTVVFSVNGDSIIEVGLEGELNISLTTVNPMGRIKMLFQQGTTIMGIMME